jgi:hypothetical protein
MDNKRNIYLIQIIVLLTATAIAGYAQDNNAAMAMNSSSTDNTGMNNLSMNDSAINNTYVNSTVFANNTTAALFVIPLDATPLNTTILDSAVLDRSALDAAGMGASGVVSISNMAKKAPEVTASSAAAQTPAKVPYDPGDSIKLGKVVGGWDPYCSNLMDDNTQKLGIPIQTMRDTGKMVFVCDIV